MGDAPDKTVRLLAPVYLPPGVAPTLAGTAVRVPAATADALVAGGQALPLADDGTDPAAPPEPSHEA